MSILKHMRADVPKKRLPVGDVVIYAVLLVLCLLLFLLPMLRPAADSLTAAIIVDGNVVETVDLSALSGDVIRSVNGCEITVTPDGVRMTAADCPDKLCVRTGAIRAAGESIACVPNRVVVILRSAAENNDPYDVVAY